MKKIKNTRSNLCAAIGLTACDLLIVVCAPLTIAPIAGGLILWFLIANNNRNLILNEAYNTALSAITQNNTSLYPYVKNVPLPRLEAAIKSLDLLLEMGKKDSITAGLVVGVVAAAIFCLVSCYSLVLLLSGQTVTECRKACGMFKSKKLGDSDKEMVTRPTENTKFQIN